MALPPTGLITSAAATEYQHFVAVREELRDPARHTRESGATRAVDLAITPCARSKRRQVRVQPPWWRP